MSSTPNLARFIEAQDRPGSGLESALAELRGTGKTGHWIWYIFPQLAGLGSSSMSRRYAIADVEEAEAYLRDPTLRERLRLAIAAVDDQAARGISLERLMGSSIDTAKLVSSLTLFGHVAAKLARTEDVERYGELARRAQRVLTIAVAGGYPECQRTLRVLRDAGV